MPRELDATVEDLITARSGVYHPASYPNDASDSAPPRGSQKPGTYYLYNIREIDLGGHGDRLLLTTENLTAPWSTDGRFQSDIVTDFRARFAVTSDGQRFLIPSAAGQGGHAVATVIVSWMPAR